jgi:hypothetical protein
MPTFEDLVHRLDAERQPNGWYRACCPVCSPGELGFKKNPSLSFRAPLKLRTLRCFKCEDAEGVKAELKRREIWPDDGAVADDDDAPPADDCLNEKTIQALQRINDECVAITNTRVEDYLGQRGITMPLATRVLAYHPRLWPGWSGTSWPAMVALGRDAAGCPRCFHRTWLTFTSPTTKAPIRTGPPKAIIGPARGAAIRLAEAGQVLLVGEGIETTLSAMQATGLPGWCGLFAGNLPHLMFPSIVREAILLQDADPAGRKYTEQAAETYSRCGLRVRIAKPPHGCKDFNDALRFEAAA